MVIGVANVKVPSAAIVRSSWPLFSSTSPVPTSPLTVPPIVTGGLALSPQPTTPRKAATLDRTVSLRIPSSIADLDVGLQNPMGYEQAKGRFATSSTCAYDTCCARGQRESERIASALERTSSSVIEGNSGSV